MQQDVEGGFLAKINPRYQHELKKELKDLEGQLHDVQKMEHEAQKNIAAGAPMDRTLAMLGERRIEIQNRMRQLQRELEWHVN